VVPDSRATTRADQFRPLNRPWPLTVLRHRHGQPRVLVEGGRHRVVASIQDSWRIDDEWWRVPISRRYYRLVLDDGSRRTVYEDLIAGDWWEQSY